MMTPSATGGQAADVSRKMEFPSISRLCAAAVVVLLGFASPNAAAVADSAEPVVVDPSEVGLDPERLARFTDHLDAAIKNGEISGAVVLVSRHGSIALFEALGKLDPNKETPMPTDAIFRLYSMTKPITALATLRTVERGEVSLIDPLDQHLPAFENIEVLDERSVRTVFGPVLTRPAVGQILLFDLIRHTAGFADQTFYPGYLGDKFKAAGIGQMDLSLAEAIERVADIPLASDPGEFFSYAETSFTTLGHVLEVVHDQPIADIMAGDVFEPLDMVDTGFEVPSDDANRLAEPIQRQDNPDANKVFDPVTSHTYASPATGLVSTALDYWRFVQMLLDNGRTISGDVYLAPITVDTMLTNSIDGVRHGFVDPFAILGSGTWGMGLGVGHPGAPTAVLIGDSSFYWVGYGGTMFLADRDRNFAMVVMIQQPDYLQPEISILFNLAMQSIVD